MIQPVIGFAGMTHLGLVSGVSAAERGFRLVCFDPDEARIASINQGKLPVSEPQLDNLVAKNRDRLTYTANSVDLAQCDVVYVAPDVPTDDQGKSDLAPINGLLETVFAATRQDAVIVVLSQVPPGFSRTKLRAGRDLYYQVETLIFGRAVDRALYPERYIVGCDDPSKPLSKAYASFLEAHGCPILPMRFESAELAKISINMFLVSSVSTTNTLAELCEKIGADWFEIVPALRLDERIGHHAYLKPGLGIAGGNLERDLATVSNFAGEYGTDACVVRAWMVNSRHRKNWAASKIRYLLLNDRPNAVVAVWGLAYKENTNSTKNSPSLVTISQLQDIHLKIFDPVVQWNPAWHTKAEPFSSALTALEGVDALLIMTPWPEFKFVPPVKISKLMMGRLVLDPFGVLDKALCAEAGLTYETLGRS